MIVPEEFYHAVREHEAKLRLLDAAYHRARRNFAIACWSMLPGGLVAGYFGLSLYPFVGTFCALVLSEPLHRANTARLNELQRFMAYVDGWKRELGIE